MRRSKRINNKNILAKQALCTNKLKPQSQVTSSEGLSDLLSSDPMHLGPQGIHFGCFPPPKIDVSSSLLPSTSHYYQNEAAPVQKPSINFS
jgi:hypothetical protein